MMVGVSLGVELRWFYGLGWQTVVSARQAYRLSNVPSLRWKYLHVLACRRLRRSATLQLFTECFVKFVRLSFVGFMDSVGRWLSR